MCLSISLSKAPPRIHPLSPRLTHSISLPFFLFRSFAPSPFVVLSCVCVSLSHSLTFSLSLSLSLSLPLSVTCMTCNTTYTPNVTVALPFILSLCLSFSLSTNLCKKALYIRKRALNFCKRALNFRGKAHSKMRGQKTEVLAAKAVGRMVQPKEVSNYCSAW